MSGELTEQTHVPTRYRFDGFVLDVPDRQLWHGDTRVELNARYLDALILLVRESGRLVEKDRFFEEVWTDVVVSDSALSQCIKEIRRQLDDDASSPRFVQTVPGYGYRFIAVVHAVGAEDAMPAAEPARAPSGPDPTSMPGIWKDGLSELGAGTLGGATAGVLGGLIYGFGLAAADAGVGTLSTLLVVVSLTVLAGLIGGVGVSLGLAGGGMLGRFVPNLRAVLRISGAAFGGLFVGAAAKLLGVDAFNLLFGRAPAGITGGPEGAALGGSLALGAYLGHRLGRRSGASSSWHPILGGALGAAAAGVVIPLAGGHLMGGSLDLLARSFSESRLQLDRLGRLLGEVQFGHSTEIVLAGLEGLLFGGCVVGALSLLDRFGRKGDPPWHV